MSNELQKPSIGELLKKQPLLIADAIQNFITSILPLTFWWLTTGSVPVWTTRNVWLGREVCALFWHFVICKNHHLELMSHLSKKAEEYLNGEKKIYASSSDWEAYDPDFENDHEIESSEIITEIVNVRLRSIPV